MLAALGPKMLEQAGSMCAGTILTMTGPITVQDYVIPTLVAASERAGRRPPDTMMMLPVSITDDVDATKQLAVETLASYAGPHVEPCWTSYRAMLDREGVDSPADISVIGDEDHVASLEHLAQLGVAEFAAVPFGNPEETAATRAVLGELSARG